MAKFCTLVDKNPQPNQPNVKTLPKSSTFVDFGSILIFPNGKVWVYVKVCKKCGYNIYLVLSFLFFRMRKCVPGHIS